MNGPGNFADSQRTTVGAASVVSRFVNRMEAGALLDMTRGRRALLVLGIGLLFGWLGPYGTWQLDAPARFGFWLAAIPAIGLIAGLCTRLVGRFRQAAQWPLPAQAAVGALIAGFPGGVVAFGLRSLLADPPDLSPAGLLRIYLSVTVVILMTWVPVTLIAARQRQGVATAGPAPSVAAGGAFLRRIPAELGSELLAISAEDHYLRVTTVRGSTLILLRLSDALAELDPDLGLQVHRSHWVARRAVAAVERDGHRTALRLVNGVRIPVSRSYVARLKQQGWLES